MKTILNSVLYSCLLLAGLAATALADTVQISFSGTVTTLSETGDYVDGVTVNVTPYTASITYDSSVTGIPFGSEIEYPESSSTNGYDFTATVGGYNFQSAPNGNNDGLIIAEDNGSSTLDTFWDQLLTTSGGFTFPTDSASELMRFDLSVEQDLGFGIPVSLLPLGDYNYENFSIQYTGSGDNQSTFDLVGSITSLSAVDLTAPEPSTLVLFGGGLLALGGAKRFRIRSARE
jgi:hypothetical protein